MENCLKSLSFLFRSHSSSSSSSSAELSSSSSMDTSISTNEIEQIPDNSTQLSTTHVQTPTKGSSNPPPMATPNSKKFSFLSRRKSKTVPTIDTSADKKNSINVENERDELLKLIHSDISYIKDAIEKVDSYNKDATEKVDKYTDFVKSQIEEVSQNLKKLNNMGGIEHYREQKKIVTKLKLKLKVPPKHSDAKYPNRNKQSYLSSKSKDAIDAKLFDKILQLYRTTIFENSPPFQDFEVRYNQLELELKLCLLCFSVFPENVIIKKRLIVYWWIGEGFINPETDEKTEEDHANELFHRLIELGFIEPIPKKRGNTIDRCKMHPFVRSSLIILAKRAKFFDFNEKGDATEGFSTSFRSCSSGKGLVNIPYLGKLHMLFNLDEGFLEFKRESFSKMRNINVLCLGKWQESATHHVLAEGTEFLNGLDSMNHLKLFSLQGVCQITEIPKSISSLSTLKILDLRACHNLQVINGGIGFLKNLTHLDMSRCYSLDQMPKELSSLLSLQVLKGFVVGHSTTKHSCTIADLAKLPKLKKLSIETGSVEFPSESELEELQKFPLLLKLTIAWGRGSSQRQQEKDGAKSQGEIKISCKQGKKGAKSTSISTTETTEEPKTLPPQLEKLDLQCFPKEMAPEWLKPANLKRLKRLYIRGGKLCDLGHFPELSDDGKSVLVKKEAWRVERLRLKYLDEMEMDWRGLQELFPKLVYLEKVKCPKLTFFPCDESGVWIERAMEGK